MATAETIATALGGRKAGGGWTARCPAHDDHTPSLSIRDAGDGKILVHCHAGCDQSAVIAALRVRGLWAEVDVRRSSFSAPIADSTRLRLNTRRTDSALDIWESAVSASATLVETYLASRRLHLPTPQELRFHPGIKHLSGGVWPAMVAMVRRGADGAPSAIHRTFLAEDGIGKAPITPQKMMLGPCRGGAVRLADAGEALMVGEGIETVLAAMQATGKPAWAALSTSGMRTLDLPDIVRDVIVLADGDDPGEAAAQHCARRWKAQGRRVRIARPPQGMDFNDLLLLRAPHIGEAAL